MFGLFCLIVIYFVVTCLYSHMQYGLYNMLMLKESKFECEMVWQRERGGYETETSIYVEFIFCNYGFEELQQDSLKCDGLWQPSHMTQTLVEHVYVTSESPDENWYSPAGLRTSRVRSSSVRTSTSSIWSLRSLYSLSSCTASPGGLADPALWPRLVFCSSCHCLCAKKVYI